MKRLSILLVVLSMSGLAPATAHEAPSGELSPVTGEFTIECDIHLPSWPSAGGAQAECWGDAYGSGSHGVAPFLALGRRNAHIDFAHSWTCFLGEPPLVGFAAGTIEILTTAGELEFDFVWNGVFFSGPVETHDPRIGGHVHPGAAGGWMSVVPRSAPIPTCVAPGPLDAELIIKAEVQGV